MARLFRSLGWAFAVPLAGALAMLLASCANPTTTPTAGTISGRIYDSSTGAGLSGATVSIGSYSATTNSSGDYTIALASGATSASGNLAITDGSGYEFIYEQGATISTTGGSETLNVPLSPVSKPTIVGTVSGTVKYQDGTAVPTNTTNSISLTIINQNGGSYSPPNVTTTSSNGVTSYSATTATVGTSCFVVVSLPSSTGEAAETYYLKNVSISSSTTLDLQPPAAASSVNITGSAGTSTTPALLAAVADVPGYGFAPIASTKSSSSTGTISVYDPDGYKLQWGQLIPSTGSTTALEAGWAASASFNPASTVSLPVPSEPEPAAGPSLSSATYSKANGTLQGFTPVSGTSGTLLAFMTPSTSASPSRVAGAVWVTGSSVTFPPFIQTLIDAGTTWTLEGASVNMSATSAAVSQTLTLLSSGGLLLYSPSANVNAGITLSNSQTISP